MQSKNSIVVINKDFNTLVGKKIVDIKGKQWDEIHFYEYESAQNMLKVAFYKNKNLLFTETIFMSTQNDLQKLDVLYDVCLTYVKVFDSDIVSNDLLRQILTSFINKGFRKVSDLTNEEVASIKTLTKCSLEELDVQLEDLCVATLRGDK